MLRRSLLLAVALVATHAMAEDSPPTPEALVNAYIKDYDAWNARATASTVGKPYDRQTNTRIVREYEEMLAKYCPSGFKGQPPSYGSNPTYDPNASVIVGVAARKTRLPCRR